jgi:hypothetical protein
MWPLAAHRADPPLPTQPVLDLSGPTLRRAFESLVESAEDGGGIERFVGALALKASLFEEVLGKGRVNELSEAEFHDLAAFITPARRRIGAWLGCNSFAALRRRLEALLLGWSDFATADRRLAAFVASFPADRAHRWARDLAAEVLHFTAPDHYPLMTRWMWDQRVNTGVLREIWHGDIGGTLAVADDFTTARRFGTSSTASCRTTVCFATCRSTWICCARTSTPPTSTTRAGSTCMRISAAARRPIRWRTRAGCSVSTRSTASRAAPASS